MGVGSQRVARFMPARITFLYPTSLIPTISRLEVLFFTRGVPIQCLSFQPVSGTAWDNQNSNVEAETLRMDTINRTFSSFGLCVTEQETVLCSAHAMDIPRYAIAECKLE